MPAFGNSTMTANQVSNGMPTRNDRSAQFDRDFQPLRHSVASARSASLFERHFEHES